MQTLPPQDDLIRQRLEKLLAREHNTKDQSKIPDEPTHKITQDSSQLAKEGRSSKAVLALLVFLASFAGTQSIMDELERHPLPAVSESLMIAPPDSRTTPATPSTWKTPGLSSNHSTLTGILDPTTLTASYYWTFELRNNSGQFREADFCLLLPHGATVSRGTLWVNGVPQEAAFGAKDVVARAYADVAYAPQHRDPLLIQKAGDDTVSIKASPVPRDGSPMLIRIGIVAPLEQLENGTCKVDLPQIVERHLELTGVTDFHIESQHPLTANNSKFITSSDGGTFITKANVDQTAGQAVTIMAGRDASLRQFATRATHSDEGFIVANLVFDPSSKANRLELIKSPNRPAVPFISDEDAAHRLSTLWAYGEAERLNKAGYTTKADELGHVFRFVSSSTSATVLERESDYTSHGLNRDRYKTTSFVPGDEVPPMLQGATSSILIPRGANMMNGGADQNAPQLQGTTNGTIGPQGMDAVVQQLNSLNQYQAVTVISGVNTPGTVRVNNLDSPLQWVIVFLSTCGVMLGAMFGIKSIAKSRRRAIS